MAAALLGPAPAAANVVLDLDVHHVETNLPPGGSGEYWFDVANIGDTGSDGPIVLTVSLPPGITRNSTDLVAPGLAWSCPGSPGDSTVTCSATGAIPRHSIDRSLVLAVDVAPWAGGDLSTLAKVEGGGAPLAAVASELTRVSAEPAGFGIVPSSFRVDFLDADGLGSVRRAGAHPELATFSFDFNTVPRDPLGISTLAAVAGNVRNLRVDLPRGFLGNPSAVGVCSPAQLTGGICPASSQVGRVDGHIYPDAGERYDGFSFPVYNMVAPRGAILDLAFASSGNPIHFRASLDAAQGYAVTIAAADVNETAPVFDLELTLWGTPAASSHDSERCPGAAIETSEECPTDAPPRPFLTLPFQCGAVQPATLRRYDSWQSTGVYGPDLRYELPAAVTDCETPRFEPSVEARPTTGRANSPSGLDVDLELPQNDNPDAPGTPPAESIVLTLPDGMTLSPAAADGLGACSLAEIGLGSNDPVRCPDSSRIGTASIVTPLLGSSMEGFVYLASQSDNPFRSLLAVYLVVRDREDRGILIKIPGRLDLDPDSGQMTVRFERLPQFPFEELSIGFRSGERAPLLTPSGCGTKTIAVQVASYAQPQAPIELAEAFDVSEGAGGGSCPPDPSARPFAPRMVAGTVNPSAGAATPFVLRLSREDRDQGLGGLTVTLPAGLSAKLAGIPLCSDAAIAAISPTPGSGAAELLASSCPAASQVGTATAGAGAGAEPIYLPGRVFLAGPYKGAPFSLVTAAPVLAGPLDLGTVAVRMAMYVDPATARIRVVSDPLPAILFGIPLHLRVLRLDLSRPGFIRNPTSCKRTVVGGAAISLQGVTAPVSSSFQVGACSSLGFKPKVQVRLLGPTRRGAHPRLRTVLTTRPGDANLGRAAVTLPGTELLATRHIGKVCTRAAFAAERCPAGSIYGRARAWTPLLDRPLAGPVYLRESSTRLPELAAALSGQVELDITGSVDAAGGRLRTVFAGLPDMPLSKLAVTLRGNRRGLLVNTGGLCRGRHRAAAAFRGHNGKMHEANPVVRTGCEEK